MDDTTAEWRNSMERRIAALETDVAVIRSNYVTKEDLANLERRVEGQLGGLDGKIGAMETRLVKWFVATAAAMSLVSFSAALTVARMLG